MIARGTEIIVRWRRCDTGVEVEALVRDDGAGVRLRKDVGSKGSEVWRVIGARYDSDGRITYPPDEQAFAVHAIKAAYPFSASLADADFDVGSAVIVPSVIGSLNMQIDECERRIRELRSQVELQSYGKVRLTA